MATCNINDLLAEVAGAGGLTGGQRRILIAKLLYDIAGETASVQDILSDANCFLCLTQAQLRLIQAQLLCNIAGGSGGGYQPPAVMGAFPKDDFEDYASGDDIDGKNGGENGESGFTIEWASDWVSEPWLSDGSDQPAISPDSLFGLQVWVKADAIVGVDDEEALDTWEDQTANDRDFTAVGAQRPIYQTGVQNGLPGVLFNAVAGVGMTGEYDKLVGDFTVMIVLKAAATTAVDRRAIQGTADNWSVGLFGGFVLTNNGAQEICYQQGSTNCHVLIISQTFADSLTKIWVDGGEAGRRDGAQTWPGVISLGATGAFNEPANAHIFEVAIYSEFLTDADALQLSKGMIAKWGI